MSYDELQARAYDTSHGRHPSIAYTVSCAEIVGGDVVVDIGCGGGHAICLAHDLGASVIGIDPSSAMLARARARAGTRSVCLKQGVCRALPLSTDSATVALLINVVHHLEDLDGSLRECRRVLRPGARLIASWECAEGMPDPEQVARDARGVGFARAWWECVEKELWLLRALV